MTTEKTGKSTLWLGAALFAIGYETMVQLLYWWLIGPPKSMEPVVQLKVTANVGLPTIQQLLEAAHQPAAAPGQSMGPLLVLIPILMIFIYGLGNAFYISTLARSQYELPGSAVEDMRRAYGKLVLWMIVQVLIGAVMVPLIALLGLVGGLLSVVLLLWFRYHFLFFEYTLVIERTRFTETFGRAVELRKMVQGRAFPYFLVIVGVNALLSVLLNGFFSYGTLALLLPLNAILLTAIQNGLMQAFFDARGA